MAFAQANGNPKGYKAVEPIQTRKTSAQSPESWAFAHQYFSRLWRIAGVLLLAATVIAIGRIVPMASADAETWLLILLGVQLVVLILPIFPTEHALKVKFEKTCDKTCEK